MAERRNMRVLLGRGAGIVARAGSGNGDRRRNSAYALSAKRIRYHDAGLAARRSAARSHRHHTTHHAIHEKTSGDGRRSDQEAVVRCHDDFDADDVVVEVNFGGDMATEVVKQAAERVHQHGGRDTNMIIVKEVSASRGKAMRAEPISLLYEKGRVLHRRGLYQLEAEMMAFSREWDRAVDGSPNRLDAMIWGITRLSKIITQIPIA